MDLGLDDKVVLVTAASRGIGLATATRLAAEGATVAIAARTATDLDTAARTIDPTGQRVTTHHCDLTDAAATDAMVDEVADRHGRLDVLVANTGGPPVKPFLDTTLEDWAAGYELLVRPFVQLAHRGARLMSDGGGGSIVFITSTWVKQPKPGGVLSASLRSAVSALAKQLAIELGPAGIRVNQVIPGPTGTGRMQSILATHATRHGTSEDQELAKIVADIPLARWGQADEIADAVAFLASDRSSYTTGTALQVDGGQIRSTL